MLISASNETDYAKIFNTIPQGIRNTILRASVKLTAQAGGTFTGSGAIVYANATTHTTTIVTAKHNLYSLAGLDDPPVWDDKYVTDFQSKVLINYGTNLAYNQTPDQTATIATVTPVVQDGGNPSWDYDVMLLTSTDNGLAGQAANYHFGPTGDTTNLTFLTSPGMYLKRTTNQTYFIQTGFGKVRDNPENKKSVTMPTEKAGTNQSGRLQFRMTEPEDKQTVTVFNRRDDQSGYYQFVDAIQMVATPNSSTAQGDSGGPLFYVSVGKTSAVYLIGVTTGADMRTSQVPCPTSSDPYVVNNISTSLASCYTNGELQY